MYAYMLSLGVPRINNERKGRILKGHILMETWNTNIHSIKTHCFDFQVGSGKNKNMPIWEEAKLGTNFDLFNETNYNL